MIRCVAGADVVIPEPAPLGALRLAWLKLRHRGRLRAGPGVRLGRDAQVRIARGARVELGEGCYLGDGCRVEAVAGTLRIGARARVGPRAFVIGHADVTLGAGCVIGDFAAVGVLDAPGRIGPVVVGESARIAAHATVGSGATVPAGAVLGSYEGRGLPSGRLTLERSRRREPYRTAEIAIFGTNDNPVGTSRVGPIAFLGRRTPTAGGARLLASAATPADGQWRAERGCWRLRQCRRTSTAGIEGRVLNVSGVTRFSKFNGGG